MEYRPLGRTGVSVSQLCLGAMMFGARISILAAFTSGQGYSADADYSPRAWLIHQTRITKGAAVGYTAWVQWAAAHPLVAAALATGEVSESVARVICGWTGKLPGEGRQDADAILLGAAAGGADVADLAGLAGEIYARSLPRGKIKDKDEDGEAEDGEKDAAFGDRSVRVETTFGGAGVLTGDLSPECASIVATVLDAIRWLCFCIMVEAWATHRQTGRKPSSGRLFMRG